MCMYVCMCVCVCVCVCSVLHPSFIHHQFELRESPLMEDHPELLAECYVMCHAVQKRANIPQSIEK